MPKQVLVSIVIEVMMILLTIFLLNQPKLVFEKQSDCTKTIARAGGLISLCVTFCWSVFLGCVLMLHGIRI